MGSVPRPPLLLLLALLTVALGCGLEEEYTGMGQRALRPQEDPTPVVCQCECGCTCLGGGAPADGGAEGEGESPLPALDGLAFRLTSLALTDPLDETSAGLLNTQLELDIDAGTLNVLLVVQVDDREQRSLEVDVGAANATEGGEAYKLVGEPSGLVANLQGVHFSTSEPAALVEIPNALLTPPQMPLRQLTLEGELDLEATSVAGGELRGALAVADAAAITLFGMPLDGALQAAAGDPAVDLDGDETPDAWGFVGTYEAARVQLAEQGGAQ